MAFAGLRATMLGCCGQVRAIDWMHPTDMLGEEILSVEVVRFLVRLWALIAPPETKSQMLRIDVALPLVLRSEG